MIYGLALPAFLFAALPIYTTPQRGLAWAVFVAGTVPAVLAYKRRVGVPLLELVGAQYAVLFALPVFYESQLFTIAGFTVPSEGAITLTIVCAALALASIYSGWSIARRFIHVRIDALIFDSSTARLFVFGVFSVVGSLAIALLGIDVPDSFAQPLMVIVSQDLGLALLACLYHAGRLSPWQRHVAVALVSAAAVVGFAGGMMQAALQPIAIWILCAWILNRRLAMVGLAALASLFFLLQPVKGAYRSQIWYGDRDLSVGARVSTYVDLVKNHWGSNAASPVDALDDIQNSAANRLSWLMTTARYVDWTPSLVDFKHGETLLYMFYTWVPRFIWQDKPIAQVANKVLPVEYGLQDAESLDRTMFGVGHVAEAYVNFGLGGIIPLFLLLGVLYYVPSILLRDGLTIPAMAILVAITVNMMYISTSIGQVFGGFLQQIIVQGLLLRVFAGVKRQSAAGDRREPVFAPVDDLLVGSAE
jgi:hypothetical protein